MHWTFAVDLAAAEQADLDAVRALVDGAGLPLGGLEAQFPRAFVVARSQQSIVGCAALETHGRSGLLRSVAVAEAHRGQGLGACLVSDRLRLACVAGLDAVYLLTTGAAEYFARLGFVTADRRAVSKALAASAEFAGVCPASATCLMFPAEALTEERLTAMGRLP
jgi:N-acetylglutamate synthase-like GNAT family acetyltransferase